MSTNYYAIMRFGHDSEVSIRYHIGKTGSGVTISGMYWPSFAEMVNFLRYNSAKIEIVSENSQNLTLDELLDIFLAFSPEERAHQHNYVAEYHPSMTKDYWLDEDGFTMCSSWFS